MYTAKDIRNIALLGHGGDGKSALCESMLFNTKAITRLGKRADGTTVSDFDDEEKKRQYSIKTSVIPVEFNKTKLNVLDNPGYFDFAGEVAAAIRVVEAGIILCTAKDGISVGAERAWKTLRSHNVPVMYVVSKTDEEHGDFDGVVSALKAKHGSLICAVTCPTSDGKGVIDLVHNVCYTTNGAKSTKGAIPAADAGHAEDLRMELMETAAGATEELMEKFFDTMELDEADMVAGIRAGMKDRSVVPVFASSAMQNIGTEAFMQGVVDYVPAPIDVEGIDPAAPVQGFVFKTVSDQFGKYSFVKVMKGSITADLSLRNVRASSTDKLGRLYSVCGKKTTEVKDACCGDIVAVGKMDWKTGDTVCDPKKEEELPGIEMPEPCYSMAIFPKTKGQDDKIAGGLARLNEEDISFNLVNNAETHQMVISGQGDIQVDVLCSKLKSRFGVDTELAPARVAYREKIKGKVEAHGRHKKQSGGSGQFGDVWIRFEPHDGDELIFESEVVGGSVPKNYFPAVEKGLQEAIQKGPLAGYPMVGLKAVLYDGSYHPVDSNDMAFRTAAKIAYKNGMAQAAPVILEPIGDLKVYIPDANLGDIMGDITKRRGRVMGMGAADEPKMQELVAEVPMAEMGDFATMLRSVTAGRGYFTLTFARYEDAPGNVAQKVIEDAKAEAEE